MKIISYSIAFGILIAVIVHLSGTFQVSEQRRGIIVDALHENNEVMEVIGKFRDLSVKKVTKYNGSPDDPSYVRYTLLAVGEDASIWVRLVIWYPNSIDEYVEVQSMW